jgi:YesN/AraC family two-component response regulator
VVGEAAHRRNAIDPNSQLHPELILIDIAMPQLNGLRAKKIIRKQSSGPQKKLS